MIQFPINQPPKVGVYKALLIQSGTNDPTAQVWQNTLPKGSTIEWTRADVGTYQGLITNVTDQNSRVWATLTQTAANGKTVTVVPLIPNSVIVYQVDPNTFEGADEININIEINLISSNINNLS